MATTLKKYLIIFAIILVAIFFLQKIKWLPSFGNLFKSKPVTIDNTPILIKEINNLAQLITITSFDEIVIDSAKRSERLPGTFLPPPDAKIVLIAKGKVMAGVDLKKLRDEDIRVKKDSIRIMFPPVQILNTILNPSDFETFDETGSWSSEEVTQIKVRMREKIVQRAVAQNLLPKAAERCKIIMENFLRNAGAKNIEITFRDQSP
ncbi:MAG TPA: DUF4230 domain-containing protein [Chitinophagaceae bacterium]|nr:DUF4230 domain-containing protein [Chitinophagaceae bacterium]